MTSSKTKKRTSGVKTTKLDPPIKCLASYFMKVSDLHTVAYWTYGNPKGKPALFVHGGPGGGTNPNCARFFDPKVYYIVLVDQRGCGKSKPTAELRENTTPNLISDLGNEFAEYKPLNFASKLRLALLSNPPKFASNDAGNNLMREPNLALSLSIEMSRCKPSFNKEKLPSVSNLLPSTVSSSFLIL